MRAIILAAGAGSRLHGAAGDNPKCLLRLGGRTLLERQLDCLRSAGIDRVTVVVGYQAARVAEVCANSATLVENERYAATNSLYSLWLTRSLLSDGALVLNGDVLFHRRLLERLLEARPEDALLVDYRPPSPQAFGEEEMKVSVRAGRVVAIAKTMAWQEADGENVGLVKFGAAGAALLVRCLDDVVEGGSVRDWAPRAFQAFCRLRPLHAVGTGSLPWIEIDFPEDYARAQGEVLPLIDDERAGAPEGAPGTPLSVPVSARAGWTPETRHV
jgi:L-glutamine-phosphate cytidylyltransferase